MTPLQEHHRGTRITELPNIFLVKNRVDIPCSCIFGIWRQKNSSCQVHICLLQAHRLGVPLTVFFKHGSLETRKIQNLGQHHIVLLVLAGSNIHPDNHQLLIGSLISKGIFSTSTTLCAIPMTSPNPPWAVTFILLKTKKPKIDKTGSKTDR